jgi:hypothetical protein
MPVSSFGFPVQERRMKSQPETLNQREEEPHMRERERQHEHQPQPGGGAPANDNIGDAVGRLLAAGDAAIERALSADSEAFLRANRQQGGQ